MHAVEVAFPSLSWSPNSCQFPSNFAERTLSQVFICSRGWCKAACPFDYSSIHSAIYPGNLSVCGILASYFWKETKKQTKTQKKRRKKKNSSGDLKLEECFICMISNVVFMFINFPCGSFHFDFSVVLTRSLLFLCFIMLCHV